MIFAEISGNKDQPTKIILGVYDQKISGRVSWFVAKSHKDTPEPSARITSFVVTYNKLYSTVCDMLAT